MDQLFTTLKVAALGIALSCQSVAVDDQGNDPAPLSVTVRDLDGMLLEDVEVCEFETSNCAKTDAEGTAEIELPSGENVLYSLDYSPDRNRYGSILVADHTDDAFPAERVFTMRDVEWIVERCEELKDELPAACEWPPGGDGHVWIFIANGGAEFDLPEATIRPFYCDYDDEGLLHCTFVELSATVPDGGGGFPEVPPGDYRLVFSGSVRTCIPDLAWAGTEPNEVRIPVRAGYVTYVRVGCTVF